MADLHFKVEDRDEGKLVPLHASTITQDTTVWTARFDLAGRWLGKEVTAVFEQGADKWAVLLDADGTCKVPPLDKGGFAVGLTATDGHETIKSDVYSQRVMRSMVGGEEFIPDDPTLYQQIAEQALKAVNAAEDVQRRADAGEFNGPKGDDGISPTATAERTEDGVTVTVTDRHGTTRATLHDGEAGHSPVLTAERDGNETIIRADGVEIGRVSDGVAPEITAAIVTAALGYSPLRDTTINGTSIVQGGVADIPMAGANVLGVSRTGSGLGMTSDGRMFVVDSTNSRIDDRTANYAITPYGLDYAVKQAMCDGKGAAWSDAEKLAARERMGLGGDFELIEEITLSESVSRLDRSQSPSGKAYSFKRFIIYMVVPANTASFLSFIYANGSAVARFQTSGASQYVQHCGAHLYIENGRCFSNGGFVSLNSFTNNLSHNGSSPMGFVGTQMNAINTIAVSQYSGEIPAGTNIKIYGVWA